jgi:hypothetical protein
MSRPLLITDCDEVLLHMVVPLREWLDEKHDVDFQLRGQDFTEALRHKDSGVLVERALVWALLTEFFDSEMARQQPIDGALAALGRIGEVADIVVLTNIGERHHALRIAQLATHGLHHPVFWNAGMKGPQLARIIADRSPSVALFVDDLAEHHESIGEHAPGVWRLHMVGEPALAPDVAPAPGAHARIDDWASAESWIMARFADGPAPVTV